MLIAFAPNVLLFKTVSAKSNQLYQVACLFIRVFTASWHASASKRIRFLYGLSSTRFTVRLTHQNRLVTPAKVSTGKKSKSGEKIPDSAQLKGVLWPGMDLFDSATAEMKRMRNQRKNSNVMRQMMATSAEIEPAEISYFADGEFRGSRDIFGPLSGENSPVRIKPASFLELSAKTLSGD